MLLAVFPVARADELSDAQAAEKAGQYARALQLYTAALEKTPEGTPEELDLFRRAIGVSSKIRPAPAPPAATVRFEGRAEAAAKGAQSPADFAMAAGEFRKAARAAPWVAAYHFNMGVTLEKAGQFAAAKDAFETYLLAAPAAPDARDVAKRIAGLEFQMEQAGRAKSEQAGKAAETEKKRADQTARVQALAGDWIGSTGFTKYRIVVASPKFEIVQVAYCPFGDCANGWRSSSVKTFVGEARESMFEGHWILASDLDHYEMLQGGQNLNCPVPPGAYLGTATLSADGSRLDMKVPVPSTNRACQVVQVGPTLIRQ